MDASEKASGKWCFFFAFPELFWLVWLISSVFLTRTSCHKITHANGYYGARPGMAVSVSVLPLTITHCGQLEIVVIFIFTYKKYQCYSVREKISS